jgi:hypothetical protein
MLAAAEAGRLLSQRHALTGQALIDVAWNQNVLKQPAFTEADADKLKEYIVLQSLAGESVNAIVTSGLFLSRGERDVLVKAIALRERLRLAETVTETLRAGMLQLSSRPDEIAELRVAARDATAFKRVEEAGDELVGAISAWRESVGPVRE